MVQSSLNWLLGLSSKLVTKFIYHKFTLNKKSSNLVALDWCCPIIGVLWAENS